MKNLTIISRLFAIVVLIAGCDEYKMVEYGEGGEINFMGDAAWAEDYVGKGPAWSDNAVLVYKYNFGINERGENLMYDTVEVAVKIMGDMVDYPRRVALTTRPSVANTIEVIFPDEVEYVVPADTFRISFPIVIKRPTRQISDTTRLVFDYANSDFTEGIDERQVIKLIIQDLVNKKLWNCADDLWAAYEKYLGDYSDAKARFLMTQYGCASFESWASKVTALGKKNQFYLDLEAYKQKCEEEPSKPHFIDENTGEWIVFPDIDN